MYVGKGRLITHYTPLQNTQLIENYVVSNAKIKADYRIVVYSLLNN